MGNVSCTTGSMFWISVTRFWNVPAARNMKTAGSLPVIYPKTNRCVLLNSYQFQSYFNALYIFFS